MAARGSYEDEFSQIAGAAGRPIAVALSGAAVSCVFNVGDSSGNAGSNPQGFNTNLTPGQSVTNFVITDTKKSDNPSSTEDLQGVAASTVSAVQYGLKGLAVGAEFLGPALNGLAWGLWYVGMMSSCEAYPTVMNLTAVTQDGIGSASTNWNLTNVGLQNIYATPYTDASWYSNQVQLAPDTGQTYSGQPLWLAQEIPNASATNCGAQSGTVTCNNEIDLIWSTAAPCPYTDGIIVNGGRDGGVEYCFQDPPTSPEVDGCGTNNSGCPAYGG